MSLARCLIVLSAMLAVAAAATPCRILWKKAMTKKEKLKVRTVPVGTTCTWVWGDPLAHCVSVKKPNPEMWKGSKSITGKGKTYSHKFTKAGLYKINCCVHISYMKSNIKVVSKKAFALYSNKCSSSCSGKCYGTNSCGNKCPAPANKSATSCNACCKIGRSSVSTTVLDACVQQCMG